MDELRDTTIRQISRLLKESIRYGLDHRHDALGYALKYARDMDISLADRFVGMYVNEWTLDYGPRGREAGLRAREAQPPIDPHRLPAGATAEVEGEGILGIEVDDDLTVGEVGRPKRGAVPGELGFRQER